MDRRCDYYMPQRVLNIKIIPMKNIIGIYMTLKMSLVELGVISMSTQTFTTQTIDAKLL